MFSKWLIVQQPESRPEKRRYHLQVDGSEVNNTNELLDQFQDARQKSTIKLKIMRGGTSQDIDVKIPRKLKTAEL